jgi:hypothetical protein
LKFNDSQNHYFNEKSYAGLDRKLMDILEDDMEECEAKGEISTEEALSTLSEGGFSLDYLRCSRTALVEICYELFRQQGLIQKFKLD